MTNMGMESIESPSAARMRVGGRDILNFGGSCYLGLSAEPMLIAAAQEAVAALGSTGQLPRHYGFTLTANQDVETMGKEYFATTGAMYFATGYLFGLITLAGLADDYDVVLLDESGHYNLRDGANAAGKPIRTFKHCDVDSLATELDAATGAGHRPLVATDGMFATFGTIPPLGRYADLLKPHGGWLVVDESHSFGVLGPHGRGAVEQEGVTGARTIAGGSLAKAFCAYGGLAVGEQAAIARLWGSPVARGAAAGMSAGAAMSAASLRYMRANPGRLLRLHDNIQRMNDMLERLNLPVKAGDSPIAAFVHGPADHMRAVQRRLYREHGIFIIYSTYVGAGPEGALRIAAFADHEPVDFERLGDALHQLL